MKGTIGSTLEERIVLINVIRSRSLFMEGRYCLPVNAIEKGSGCLAYQK